MARKLRVEYAGAIYHLPSLKIRRDKCAESRGSGGNTVSSLEVEPGFGTASKLGLGFRQFRLRGQAKVALEWTLVCLAYNLKRLHRLGAGLKLAATH
jgi:hypothetical protein